MTIHGSFTKNLHKNLTITGLNLIKFFCIVAEIREPSIQWLSSSGQAPFSREYLSNNLQLPVRFTGAATKIPSDALLLEVNGLVSAENFEQNLFLSSRFSVKYLSRANVCRGVASKMFILIFHRLELILL